MGWQVLQVKHPFSEEKLRSYGHCGQKPGKIGLMFVNYGEKKLEIKLPFRCKHEIFHLQGRKGLHRLDFRNLFKIMIFLDKIIIKDFKFICESIAVMVLNINAG